MNRARGIRTVLIPEPVASQGRSASDLTRRRHEAVRRVALRNEIPLIEVHDDLERKRGAGFLWWDRAHLSSFGQKLLAERIFQADGWR